MNKFVGERMNPKDIGRKLCFLGFIAVIAAWIVIISSWILNSSWFVFTRDAFSDFGGANSCCPELYNYGLIIVGAMIILFSLGCMSCTLNNIELIGWSYMVLAGVFLALIGIYPSGTRPHVFVSTWFFIQSDISLIIVLSGIYRKIKDNLVRSALWASILAFPVAFLIEILVGWPSAAVIETYGILIIDYAVIIALYAKSRLREC